MSRYHFTQFISRRDAVKLLVGSAGTACGLPILNNPVARAAVPVDHLQAVEETIRPAAPYTPKFFKPDQMQLLAELVEIIIPTDEHSPGAKAARVHEYIDEVVADAQPEDKDLWTKALVAIEGMAQREHGKAFLECSPEQQLVVMEKISKNEEHPQTLEDRFFKALKNATVNGYYTSAIGIHQDLQYIGNTYLDEFPGCTHPEHQCKQDP